MKQNSSISIPGRRIVLGRVTRSTLGGVTGALEGGGFRNQGAQLA